MEQFSGSLGRRQAAYRRGISEERKAAWWLRLKGFSILASRYRSPYGEIDLIARRGKLLVFAEIKARPTSLEGLEAISTHQQQRILSAAQHFLQVRGWHNGELDLRFDAITCLPGKLMPDHVPDAWRLN